LPLMRLLLVTEIPAPFRIPSFNALARNHDVDLHLVVVAENDPRRRYSVDPDEFQFAYHVLPGRSFQARGRWLVLNGGFGQILQEVNPEAILVGGWNQPVFWNALVAARRRSIPALLWVESTHRDARMKNPIAGALRRSAVRLADGFVVPGRASAGFLQIFGVAADRIAVAPNAVEPNLTSFGCRQSARDELGLAGFLLLYVGRLEREKGVDVLMRALHDVSATLAVVGDGSMRAELERLAPPGRVIFAGHVERDELSKWYAAADAFVLPSRSDVWGMVLNEAAAAGLPLVASEVAGAAHELIETGINGYLVPADDPSALARTLRRVEGDAAWRAQAGRRSRELAQRFRPEAWAMSVAELTERMVASKRA
jgi:glycosyltransferase involved in cell wall biosynthesis